MQVNKIIFTVTNDLVFDQRMNRICGSLTDSGYEVLLVGRKLKNSPLLTEKKYKQKRIRCFFNKGKLFYAEFNVRLFTFLLFKSGDCLCAIDLDTILPVYYISWIKRTRRVYDAHEYFSQLDEVVSRPPIYRFWKNIESKFIPRFKSGYTVCESIASEFKKNYGVKYDVIRNVPLQKDDFTVLSQPNTILYQGAVNRGRGLDKLALAMKNIEASLWICGDGNYMNELRSVVLENKLADKIVFFGMLKPEDLLEKTARAYIAVNPFDKRGLNQYFSLSNKFFDYIHASIPQVTMNYPEYARINNEFNVAVLIDDLDPLTISSAINNLLTNKNLYIQLKENCKLAKSKLNWQTEEGRLLSFYKTLFDA